MATPSEPNTTDSAANADPSHPASDAERQLKYEDRVLGWVDILGWSALLEESAGNPEKFPALLSGAVALRLSKDAKEASEEVAEGFNKNNTSNPGFVMTTDNMPEISHFSDTVIWSCPTQHFPRSNLVEMVQHTCCLLLANGYLSRGAIVQGPLFHERGTVFGPAVLEAHRLETKVADTPRILIDESMGDLMPRTYSFEGQTYEYLECRTDDFDGRRYLDILGGGPMRTLGTPDHRRMPSGWDEPALLAMAEARLADLTDQKKRDKWAWMVKYLQDINSETDMSIPIPRSWSASVGKVVMEKVIERHARQP